MKGNKIKFKTKNAYIKSYNDKSSYNHDLILFSRFFLVCF